MVPSRPPHLASNTAHSPRRPPQHAWLFWLAKALTGTHITDIMVRVLAWSAHSGHDRPCALDSLRRGSRWVKRTAQPGALAKQLQPALTVAAVASL